MLTPKKIETFCRWWSRELGREVNSGTFFVHAYVWKFGKLDEKRALFAYIAFTKSGYIPDFVKEYWHKRVLKYILIQGGPNDQASILPPPP